MGESPLAPSIVRGSALLSVAGLVATIVAVAVVAVSAELTADWNYYFLMQQVIATATPIAVAFLCLTVLSGFGVVAVATKD